MLCVTRTVVVFCHANFSAMNQFLFHAQDNNMTNGDFAFFTFYPIHSALSMTPWKYYVTDLDLEALPWRRRAFYAVKQVKWQHDIYCIYYEIVHEVQ